MEIPPKASAQEQAALKDAGQCFRNPPQAVAFLQPVQPSPANPQGVGYSVQGVFPPVKMTYGCHAWENTLLAS